MRTLTYSRGMLLAVMMIGAGHAAADTTQLHFCTGAEGGFYDKMSHTIGNNIVRETGAKLTVINTGGSYEVAEKLKDGTCDIGLLQGDAVVSLPLPNDIEVTDAHVEAVYWLHPKDGIDDFGKMEKTENAKKYAVAVIRGGGSQVTMAKFATMDKDYAQVRVIEFEDWMQAGKAIAQGFTTRNGEKILVAGGLYVGRMGAMTSDITEDFGSLIQVGEVNDSDFADAKDQNGNALYFKCSIEKAKANGMTLSTFAGRSVDTYCMRAQIVYTNAYTQGADKETARKVNRAVAKAVNSEVKQYR